MIRIMGLDFGSKTVGVAVSDPLGITAQGIEIVRRTSENKLRKTLARIVAVSYTHLAMIRFALFQFICEILRERHKFKNVSAFLLRDNADILLLRISDTF